MGGGLAVSLLAPVLATRPAAAIDGIGMRPAARSATVSMEAVLKAAQWDPVKPGTGLTPGAGESVRHLERALVEEGLLDERRVDGHFGTATVDAFAAWQRSLGLIELAATGLPQPVSLTPLAAGRFALARVVDIGPRTTRDGFALNTRTLRMLTAAERLWGHTLTIEQGSYSPGTDPTSKGTHDGGGALDLDAESLTPSERTDALRALRRVGFAAWLRDPSQDDWPWHIHAVAISDTDLAPLAQRQVGRYYEGRNGLADNGPDDGPRVTKVTFEEFLRSELTSPDTAPH